MSKTLYLFQFTKNKTAGNINQMNLKINIYVDEIYH